MKKWALGALAALVIGIVGVAATFNINDFITLGGKEVSISKKVEASKATKINVNSRSSNIIVESGNSDSVVVTLYGTVSEKYKDKIALEVKEEGDSLIIASHDTSGFSIGINIINLTMKVELPRKLYESVVTQTSSGNVQMANGMKSASLTIQSISGNVRLTNADTKSLLIKSTSGNVNADDFRSETAQFETTSGNVTLTNGLGVITGKSVSGNVKLSLNALTSDVELSTTSGNAGVNLTKQPANVRVDFHTSSGNPSIGWEGLNYQVKEENVIFGFFDKGDGPQLNVNTSSGDIKLNKR
jgi:lia operon protein LiaG